MTYLKNEVEYNATMARIEELLPLVDDDTPADDKNCIELTLLSNLAANYKDIHYPIAQPTLTEII